jgi:chromate transporter
VQHNHGISFSEATRTWAWVGLNSFGGPAGQIAVMHRKLVEEKRWIGEDRFLHALNYCMLLPGPEAQQLAVYVGWLLHGVPGGLVAGTLFVLPGYVALLVLSTLYAEFHEVAFVGAALFGLKAAVLAVVVEAVIRIGKRVLKNRAMTTIAVLAFVALFVFSAPFPLVVLTAGGIGLAGGRFAPDRFVVIRSAGGKGGVVDAMLEADVPAHARPSARRAALTAATWLALWLVPVVGLWFLLGPEHVFTRIGVFFSQAAAVTFGGAYAVLAFVAQRAVETYHWLAPGEMLDGLGMAETTPGPLILVLQHVGFLAAYRNPGALPPLAAGFLGATLTVWVTFAPCFLWIFLGAPWVEALRGRAALSAALSAITAAVVGVVLNLAVWFGIHVLFHQVAEVRGLLGTRWAVPELGSLDPVALVIAVLSALALLRYHVGMTTTLGGAALLGIGWWWVGG